MNEFKETDRNFKKMMKNALNLYGLFFSYEIFSSYSFHRGKSVTWYFCRKKLDFSFSFYINLLKLKANMRERERKNNGPDSTNHELLINVDFTQ